MTWNGREIMKYYALYLNNNSYVEKCLALIKVLGNPKSSSAPHITLRTFRSSNTRIEDVKRSRITHLNFIEPGSFNLDREKPLDGNKTLYVIYIRCESLEIERIEYKPDFRFSRPHITLYEGDNDYYANKLLELLCERKWRFKLLFNTSRELVENTIGSKKVKESLLPDIKPLFIEMLGENIDEDIIVSFSDNEKLLRIRRILDNLDKYLLEGTREVEPIDQYLSEINLVESKNPSRSIFANGVVKNELNQFSFDGKGSCETTKIMKPVQDAIFVTPPEYANDMAICALDAFGDDSRTIDFGDSAIGTGTLFLAMKHYIDEINISSNGNYSISSAIGIEIDLKMADEAISRYSDRGLTVIYGDAISPELKLDEYGKKRNLMLVNPPYNRHEDIPKDYRKRALTLAEEQTGIRIMGDAGLYVYHMLIMDKWLADGGIAVWLLPSIFLQSRYGNAIRKYLLNNVQLIRMHIYDDKKTQFDNTHISTTIVVIRKEPPGETSSIPISFGESVNDPQYKRMVRKESLLNSADNWRIVIDSSEQKSKYFMTTSKKVKFEDLFSINRGIATGANSFFVLEKSKAKKIGIPDIALKPLLPKARYIKSSVINSLEDGYPDVEPQLVLIDCDLDEMIIKNKYPMFFEYLQKAKTKQKDGTTIVERSLVSTRNPWYKQEKREVPLFLLTYMGRKKTGTSPLYFLHNKSKAIALNTYLLLYPRERLKVLLEENEGLIDTVFSSLRKSAEIEITQQTRVYAGGLHKIEPNTLKKMTIIDLPDEIVDSIV